MTYYDVEQPLYTIKRFTEDTYSVCKFKRSRNVIVRMSEPIEHETKLDSAYSRARSMIRQYGLCNPWDYFVTLTLDKNKYNRHDLGRFKKDLSQFIRDMRKKYGENGGKRLSFLLVPENHKDGAWHMHGLIYGLPDGAVSPFVRGVHPDKLVNGGFLDWPDYAKKFGFVSLGKIRDQLSTVLYTTKYINKDIEALAELRGEHLYMASRPLNTAETIAEVYLNYKELDDVLTQDYKFCSTGFVTGAPWYWPYQFDLGTVEDMFPPEPPPKPLTAPLTLSPGFNPETIDPSAQMNLFDLRTV